MYVCNISIICIYFLTVIYESYIDTLDKLIGNAVILNHILNKAQSHITFDIIELTQY